MDYTAQNAMREGQPFGFHAQNSQASEGTKEVERSQLEESLSSEFVDMNKEPFPHAVGRWVDMNMGGLRGVGLYQGMNDRSQLVFLPVVVNEPRPLGDKKVVHGYAWSNEDPVIISYVSGASYQVTPSSEESLNVIVERGHSGVDSIPEMPVETETELDNQSDSKSD